jgi:hypothetical protein
MEESLGFMGDEVLILLPRGSRNAYAWISNDVQTDKKWD